MKKLSSFDPTPVRFDYTGSVQVYTVPSGVSKIFIDCVGASGSTRQGNSNPGKGGRVECILFVTGGQKLNIYVGQQGQSGGASNAFNGGGRGSIPNNTTLGANGGGASDIRLNGNSLSDRIIVAGGGSGFVYSDKTPATNGKDGGIYIYG